MASNSNDDPGGIEPFVTFKQASKILGLHLWALYQAGKAGIIPVYKFVNGRKMVRVSEILLVIEASKKGGDK
jgi:hypothetical protein